MRQLTEWYEIGLPFHGNIDSRLHRLTGLRCGEDMRTLCGISTNYAGIPEAAKEQCDDCKPIGADYAIRK